MSPKVSVIVTIFNREKYIKECVQSLFEQTLDNIEYVFVDDASKDRSIEELTLLMYKFPKRIPQVKIIRLKYNGGVANARNVGLQNSTGEYVIHADSDDWIDKEMYEILYQKAIDTDADIIGCNITHEYPSMTTVLKQHYGNTIEENITKLSETVKELDSQPKEKWNKATWIVLSAFITAAVGMIISSISNFVH